VKYLIAFFAGLALAVWVNQAKENADKYNQANQTQISTWQAMFLNYTTR